MIKAMDMSYVAQLNAMQNCLIAMERCQTNRFQPKTNKEWQRRGPPQDQRPPNQSESTNMVQEEVPPYCRACKDFHEESSCPIFYQINEQGLLEINNFVGYPYRQDFINNIGKTYSITVDQMRKVKEMSLKTDNVTKLYSEKPTPKEILVMVNNRYKGLTYQRKGNDSSCKIYQEIPKAIPPTTTDLSVCHDIDFSCSSVFHLMYQRQCAIDVSQIFQLLCHLVGSCVLL